MRDNIISLLNAQDLGSLGIKDCSEVTDEHLTRIRFLDLTGGGLGQKITSLKSGDFEGLSGMGELVLADNSLSELPEGVFDGLSSLAILTMQGNDLGSLPDGVFDDLTNLDALALYDNDLAALPDGIFERVDRVEHAVCFRQQADCPVRRCLHRTRWPDSSGGIEQQAHFAARWRVQLVCRSCKR